MNIDHPLGVAVLVALVVGALVFVPAGVEAGTDRGAAEPTVCGEDIDALVAEYNENVGAVPGFVRDRVSGKQVHGVVNDPEGGDLGLRTAGNGSIVNVSTGKPANPEVRVITDCETLRTVANAENPASSFWRQYKNDQIRIVGVGPANWLAIGAMNRILSLGGTISDTTGLGPGASVAVAAGIYLLLLLLLLVVLFYAVYRRATHVRRRRRKERAEEFVAEQEDEESSGAEEGPDGDGAAPGEPGETDAPAGSDRGNAGDAAGDRSAERSREDRSDNPLIRDDRSGDDRTRDGRSGDERDRGGRSGDGRGRGGQSGDEPGRGGRSGDEQGRGGQSGDDGDRGGQSGDNGE